MTQTGASPLNSNVAGSQESGFADGTDAAGSDASRAASSPADSKAMSSAKKAAYEAKRAADAAKAKEGTAAAAPAAGSTGGASGSKAKASSPAAAKPQSANQPAASGWHDNIITTIFWTGEAADASNNYISNSPSAWDGNWSANFGGLDDPDNRNGYYPAAFTPRENPFYFALPYNDLNLNGTRKASASNCPNKSNTISWCKNAWIKISKNGKVAYAQWQDVGPLQEDDVDYVFGTARPKNTWGAKAGLDVSPAVRDYLGLSGIDTTSWAFVPASAVPAGPWKNIVTTSQGGW